MPDRPTPPPPSVGDDVPAAEFRPPEAQAPAGESQSAAGGSRGSAGQSPAAPPPRSWRRRRPLRLRARLLIAGLCALVGFGFVTQVRSTSRDAGLGTARQEDLVRILDDLTGQTDRLRQEVAALEQTRDQLESGQGGSAAALAEARRRAQTLGILAGTVPATGPGIRLTVTDPERSVQADVLLDTLQELRDAGAEAIQIGPVRAVTSTHLVDSGPGIEVDGQLLEPPYRFTAIGDPATLTSALGIPGGIVDTVAELPGADTQIERFPRLTVSALRPIETPRYARPAPVASP